MEEHATCEHAWAKAKQSQKFAEAKLESLRIKVREAANALERLDGHKTYEGLGGRTLAGHVRHILWED